MKDEEVFREALAGKQIPILILDTKWHRLFAMHGKSDQIRRIEGELNGFLAEQGQCNQELKDLRNRCRYNRTGLIPQAEQERTVLENKLEEGLSLEKQVQKQL